MDLDTLTHVHAGGRGISQYEVHITKTPTAATDVASSIARLLLRNYI